MPAPLLLAALALSTPGMADGPTLSDTDKLVACARLYGVVRWFHPSDAAQQINWDRMAVACARQARQAKDRGELAFALQSLFEPVTVGLEVGDQLPPVPDTMIRQAPFVAWRHLGLFTGDAENIYQSGRTGRDAAPFKAPVRADDVAEFELVTGLRARVPLVLSDGEAKTVDRERRALDALRVELEGLPDAADPADADVRASDVIVAWNLFRHFYPYWSDLSVDWDARLPSFLEASAAADTREAHRESLRALVARIYDGHGQVVDPKEPWPSALPVAARWIEDQLVVIATEVPEKVQAGDVITAIDGEAAEDWLAPARTRCSGSAQWCRFKETRKLHGGPKDSVVALTIQRGAETLAVELARDREAPPDARRPEAIAELQPGTWYVDLTRADTATLVPRLSELAAANAVIFDVRGYPTDAGMGVLPHLITRRERDRWMHVPRFVGPWGELAGWQEHGWNLRPREPHVGGRVAFLTDGRAISYAESVLGYVSDLKLGEIFGSPTAGANGNVNRLKLPSGLTVTFTGMRVTRHDGSPFHTIGVQPTVPVEPTIEGVRAGRDEVLERALAWATGA